MLRDQMGYEHRRSAQCNAAGKGDMSGPRQTVNPVGPRFHLYGSGENLLADRGELAGSWQPIDESHIERGFKSGEPTTDGRVIDFETPGCARQRAAMRHGHEIANVFPIHHMCKISRITGKNIEFSHTSREIIFQAKSTFWIALMSSRAIRPRLTLIGSALGFVVVLLDVSVVNVALDAFRSSFSTNVAGLEWVVNAYTLVFAALLLTAGALGDRFGARQIFLAGFVLFTAASLACGLAPTLTALVVARIVQGAGAALLVPNSLSLIQQAFPDQEERSRAIGWWGAAGGIALAAGPVAGGFLVAHFGWRSIFLINLPIGLTGLAVTLRFARLSPANAQRALDVPGQVAAIIALAALATALIDAGHLGWTHPRIIGALVVAVVSAVAFVAIEANKATPMLPLSLFQSRDFTIASVSGVLVNFAYYGLIFVFSLFFQWQLKFGPEQTGLAFLPMTVVLMAMNIIAGRLISRLGARRLMVLGQALAAVGYLLLIPALEVGSHVILIVPMLIAASGIALMVPTMTNVTLSSVDPSRAGIASGVLNTARQVGGMLGVAVCGYLVRDVTPTAFAKGMHLSLSAAVALLVFGALLSFVGLERHQKLSAA